MIRFRDPLSFLHWWKHILIGYTFLICLLSSSVSQRSLSSEFFPFFSSSSSSLLRLLFPPFTTVPSSSFLYVNAVPIAYWYERNRIPLCPIPPGIPYQQAYPIHVYTYPYNRSNTNLIQNRTTSLRRLSSSSSSSPSTVYPIPDLFTNSSYDDKYYNDNNIPLSIRIKNLMQDNRKTKEEIHNLVRYKLLHSTEEEDTVLPLSSPSLSSSSTVLPGKNTSFPSSPVFPSSATSNRSLFPASSSSSSSSSLLSSSSSRRFLLDTNMLVTDTDLIVVGFSYCTTLDPWGSIIPLPTCDSTIPPSLTITRSRDAGRTWDCNYGTAPSSALRIGASTVSGIFIDLGKPCSLMCILGGWFLINGNFNSITRSVLCSNDGGLTWVEGAPLPTSLVWATATQLSPVAVLVVGGIREDTFDPEAALIGIVDTDTCSIAYWIDIPSPPGFGVRITPLVNSQVTGDFRFTQRVLIGGGIAPPTVSTVNQIRTWSMIIWSTLRRLTLQTEKVDPSHNYFNDTVIFPVGPGNNNQLSSSLLSNRVPLVDSYLCDPCDTFQEFRKVNGSLPIDNVSPVSVILSWGGPYLQNTSIGDVCYKASDPVFRCLVFVSGQRIFISTVASGPPRWSPFDLVLNAGTISRTPRTPVPTGWILNQPQVIENRNTPPIIIAIAYSEKILTIGVPVPCAPVCGNNEFIGGCPYGPESGYCSTCSTCKLGSTFTETACYYGIQATGGYGGDTICKLCTTCEDNTLPYGGCNLTSNTQCPYVNPSLICKVSTVLQASGTDTDTSLSNGLPTMVSPGTSPAFVSAIFVMLIFWFFAFLLPAVVYERAFLISKPWLTLTHPYLRRLLYLVQKIYSLIGRDILYILNWFTIIIDNWMITVLFSLSESCSYYIINTNKFSVTTIYSITSLILLWMLGTFAIGILYRIYEVYYYSSSYSFTGGKLGFVNKMMDSSSLSSSSSVYYRRCYRENKKYATASLPFDHNGSVVRQELSWSPLPIFRTVSSYLHPRTLWSQTGSIWYSTSALSMAMNPTNTVINNNPLPSSVSSSHGGTYPPLDTPKNSSNSNYSSSSSPSSSPPPSTPTVQITINYRYLLYGLLILLYDLVNAIIIGLGIMVLKTSPSLSYRLSNSVINAQNAQTIILDCIILGFGIHFCGIIATMVQLFDYIQYYQQKHYQFIQDFSSFEMHRKIEDNPITVHMNISRSTHQPSMMESSSTGLFFNYPYGIPYTIASSPPSSSLAPVVPSSNTQIAKVDNTTLSSLLAREGRTQHLSTPSSSNNTNPSVAPVTLTPRSEYYPIRVAPLGSATPIVNNRSNENDDYDDSSENTTDSSSNGTLPNHSIQNNNSFLASVLASSLRERPPGTVISPIVNKNNPSTVGASSSPFYYNGTNNNSDNNSLSHLPQTVDHHYTLPERTMLRPDSASASSLRLPQPDSHVPSLPPSFVPSTTNTSSTTSTTALANMSRDHIEALRRVVLHLASQEIGNSSDEGDNSNDDHQDNASSSSDYPVDNRSRRSNSTDEPSTNGV